MRRRGRHDQGAPVPEHVQESTHYRRSTANHPADRAQGGEDQQGDPRRDADAREVLSETGFRPEPSLEISYLHADSGISIFAESERVAPTTERFPRT